MEGDTSKNLQKRIKNVKQSTKKRTKCKNRAR